jgi:hypothetical protein
MSNENSAEQALPAYPLDPTGLIGLQEVEALGVPWEAIPLLRRGFNAGRPHGLRLSRAVCSQAQFGSDVPEQVDHALSRYGIWAHHVAEDIRSGHLKLNDVADMLEAFAAVQNRASSLW